MQIIITENQKYVLRRLQQFIGIVEERIDQFELDADNPWWCMAYYNPETFLYNLKDRSIDDFIDVNWEFFHDDSEMGGSNMDLSVLDKIFNENYGNYVRNLWVRKCGQSR